MAFLEDNVWINVPAELAEYLEDLTQFWNAGKIPADIAAAPPTSTTGSDGPAIRFAKDGANWKIYVYTNSTDKWQEGTLSAVA